MNIKSNVEGAQVSVKTDSFGNEIDPVVGFARGNIIRSSTDEGARLRHGQAVAASRVIEHGSESIGIFTGNQRDYLVKATDLDTYCEEWVGPGLSSTRLNKLAIEHMGGDEETDSVAIFNRTSAAIVSVIASCSGGRTVVSIVPPGGRSHASVVRGAKLAGVPLVEVQGSADWRSVLQANEPRLVVVTTVTSSLELLSDNITLSVVDYVKQFGSRVFLDEAYGARLRPVLHSGIKSLKTGADLAVTNCDKAGLPGPRAGILVGAKDMIGAAAAKGAEYGMEARAPISAGVMRSLQSYDPQHLIDEAKAGKALAADLIKLLGDCVQVSDLGPMVHEDDILRIILKRAGIESDKAPVVPCEATSALGMILLRDYGILTVNTHGQPGARVSVRLKPSGDAIRRVGGQEAIIKSFDESLTKVAAIIHDSAAMIDLILGGK